jgi:hypothetical protein
MTLLLIVHCLAIIIIVCSSYVSSGDILNDYHTALADSFKQPTIANNRKRYTELAGSRPKPPQSNTARINELNIRLRCAHNIMNKLSKQERSKMFVMKNQLWAERNRLIKVLG